MLTLTLSPPLSPIMTPPASLMGLPTELHLAILEHLPFPDSHGLKLTNRHFYNIVKPLNHADLLAAEKTRFAIGAGLYACKDCVRLRTACRFGDQMKRQKKRREGSRAKDRFCLDCGVNPAPGTTRYAPGNRISLAGEVYVICTKCGWFSDGVEENPAVTVCRECWLNLLVEKAFWDKYED